MINQHLVKWMIADLENRMKDLGRQPTLDEVRHLADEVAAEYCVRVLTVLPDPAKPDGFLITSEFAP